MPEPSPENVAAGRRAIESGVIDRVLALSILDRATRDGTSFLEAARRSGLPDAHLSALGATVSPATVTASGTSGGAAPTGARPKPGDRVGPYVLDRILGQGGMGAVYVGVHQETGARHAVKVPFFDPGDDVARKRFDREARSLAQLRPHPNVVRVFAAGEDKGTLWVALELIEGRASRSSPASSRRSRSSAPSTSASRSRAASRGRDVRPRIQTSDLV